VNALKGKVALITGGARGMGESHARLMSQAGATVIIADLLESQGKAVASRLGADVMFIRHDVASEGDWNNTLSKIEHDHGRLDVVVNNAAVLKPLSIADTTLAEFERMVRVNQTGTFLGIKMPVELMKRTGGSIINLSSIAGFKAFTNHIAYASTKWAVRGMTRVAAIELAPHKIRVNSVHPGAIDTKMLTMLPPGAIEAAAKLTPLGRLGEPDEVGRLVLFLASDRSCYITGSEIAIDGGWSA
jgi:3alpha(or 20beta)-hydroxysteroid dehydrogenase